jgi:hypothetical protein
MMMYVRRQASLILSHFKAQVRHPRWHPCMYMSVCLSPSDFIPWASSSWAPNKPGQTAGASALMYACVSMCAQRCICMYVYMYICVCIRVKIDCWGAHYSCAMLTIHSRANVCIISIQSLCAYRLQKMHTLHMSYMHCSWYAHRNECMRVWVAGAPVCFMTNKCQSVCVYVCMYVRMCLVDSCMGGSRPYVHFPEVRLSHVLPCPIYGKYVCICARIHWLLHDTQFCP